MNTIAKIAICFAGFYFAEHAILAGAYLIGLVCTLVGAVSFVSILWRYR
tara:strand:- start:1293 stop:1439 length:147 start_codon:yes stop_codon:yes gene_type:complete